MTVLVQEELDAERELGIAFHDEPPFEECGCLVDGHHGIYVPQVFAERHAEAWGLAAEDRAILLAGPDPELYWDTWSDVLDEASREEQGKTWFLYQDQDLFAVTYAD